MTLQYGIVIDSGSSGSRVQIYSWPDVAQQRAAGPHEILQNPPAITQEPGWSKKVSPGISSYASRPGTAWAAHYKPLLEFAAGVVPAAQIEHTPVYILSTAGMRLLPASARDALLRETCRGLRQHTQFLVGDCADHVQTIDGSAEGVYGWLALNYLMGLFVPDSARSVGFMDMGGASAQIAFVPSAAEIAAHDDDLASVTLRSIDGHAHTWRVFVATWLGFGANQGRTRYLEHLIQLTAAARPGVRLKVVRDPCMPKGSSTSHGFGRRTYRIEGTGDYAGCLRETYPLLMKNVPCADEPCLFNGIHAPKMDFEADAFVGVSEYWYTANDIFHSGGEYNFHGFSEKTREFCESPWDSVLENRDRGLYSHVSEDQLRDACFKAAWVINVLHEGFGLPRLALDIEDKGLSDEAEHANAVHVPFKSADSVDGTELSWTLGKMLLVAAAQVVPADDAVVGVVPSLLSMRELDDSDTDDDDGDDATRHPWFFRALLCLLLLYVIYRVVRKVLATPRRKLEGLALRALSALKSKLPSTCAPLLNRVINYMELQQHGGVLLGLEEGISVPPPPSGSVLRTRSSVNVADHADFMSKPFANPNKAFHSNQPLARGPAELQSSGSIVRPK